MTDSHQPNDKLVKLFSSAPEPDPKAKQAAKELAMAAFVEQQAQAEQTSEQKNNETRQGFFARLRLTLINQINEVIEMQKRWIVSGALASVCVVAVTAIFIQITQPELLELSNIDKAANVESELDHAEPSAVAADRAAEQDLKVAEQSERRSEAFLEEVVVTASKRGGGQQFERMAAAPPQPASQAFSDGIQPIPEQRYRGEDEFSEIDTNPIKLVSEQPVSTFSIDVDTASYSFVRRQLNHGVLPQKDTVRLEEMVNYFDYQYPLPETDKQPFSTNVLVQDSPWRAGNKLIHIGIKGYELPRENLPKSNLVFLLDVSGSMNQQDKLPLVKQSMELLLSQLNPDDTVAIVVYAGAAGTVLEPTAVSDKQTILQALNRLNAGGSTAGAEGIQLAYQLAESQFDKNAVNRVVLATDGDFNVGITNHQELKGFIERKRDKGIFLSVLGFGQGNYHDNLMQELAQNGNGVAAYIDTLSEAQKVLVHQATSTLFTIAKDVKIQVEFNPATVSEYRLLGFETRLLNKEDFNNDKVDAGDIGAGHTVTAIYEITPTNSNSGLVDESRYQTPPAQNGKSTEYGFLKLRYKLPEEQESRLIEQPISIAQNGGDAIVTREANFATAVAGFAQLLRGGKFINDFSYDEVIELAHANKGEDLYGYRTEFVQLVRKAKVAKSLP